LKKHLNIEAMNSDSYLKQLSMLFTKEGKGLLLNEVQMLGPDYTDELDNDFTLQEITKCILRMKNKKKEQVQMRHGRYSFLMLNELKF